MKSTSILTATLLLALTTRAEDAASVRLITLDPGHFHAALVQKTRYPQVSPVVHVYAPAGADLDLHLKRVEGFNLGWQQKVHTGPGFLEQMLKEKPGNVVIISGNNARKTEYIYRCIEAGLHVLADKPMAIDPAGFDLLKQAFALARQKKVLLYDIMTERYEITTILQRALSRSPAIFGQLDKGTPERPAITKESVHFFSKEVAGKPLIRPAWFFDVTQQGEALPDVGTHLVDLIQWECFPEETLSPTDVKILTARRWSTKLAPAQFKKVTGADRTGDLEVYSNGETIYTLRGVHAKVSVLWKFEGGPDTHYSVMRGTKANLVIENGKLMVQTSNPANLEPDLRKAVAPWPGVDVKKASGGWEIIIPAKYNVGHEAHFGEVTSKFLRYLADGKLPAWEEPNMITKYATTTGAYQVSHRR
jgi:predicted dehydrogenase